MAERATSALPVFCLLGPGLPATPFLHKRQCNPPLPSSLEQLPPAVEVFSEEDFTPGGEAGRESPSQLPDVKLFVPEREGGCWGPSGGRGRTGLQEDKEVLGVGGAVVEGKD